MKILRIILQLIILGGGAILFAAIIAQPNPELTSIIFLLGFVAFLFSLTLALKEHTEKRFFPGHKLSSKPMCVVLLLLGAFAIFLGLSFLIGNESLPSGNGSCRAVCGLILLLSQLFGNNVARIAAFGLWSTIGLFLCFVSYKVHKANAT